MKRQLFILALGLTITLMVSSCKKDNPVVPPVEPPAVLKDTVTLSITGVTHRSVDVNVQCTMNNAQYSVLLYRRLNNTDTLAAEYPVEAADTTITDDNNGEGLLLDTEYKYYAVTRDSTGEIKDTSNTVSARTLPVTSHNYTWQEYTIGGFGSALYDVWGTDENNVYAVGGVTINDTTYGIIKWDGVQWRGEKRIGGQYTVYGFSASDIWTAGEGVYHFNGVEWKQVDAKTVNSQSIPLDSVLYHNKPYTSIWGTSSSNLYLGNQWGKIIRWDGSKGEVLRSYDGTWITDISGIPGRGFYVVGTKNTTGGNNLAAFYDFSTFEDIDNPSLLNISPLTVKMFSDDFVLIGGNNLYVKEGSKWHMVQIGNYGTINRIRGDQSNNIFAVGFYKEVYHFNGVDWHFYSELNQPHGEFNGVFVSNNMVFIVGQDANAAAAKIIIGRK